jgi:hypothetical protein
MYCTVAMESPRKCNDAVAAQRSPKVLVKLTQELVHSKRVTVHVKTIRCDLELISFLVHPRLLSRTRPAPLRLRPRTCIYHNWPVYVHSLAFLSRTGILTRAILRSFCVQHLYSQFPTLYDYTTPTYLNWFKRRVSEHYFSVPKTPPGHHTYRGFLQTFAQVAGAPHPPNHCFSPPSSCDTFLIARGHETHCAEGKLSSQGIPPVVDTGIEAFRTSSHKSRVTTPQIDP